MNWAHPFALLLTAIVLPFAQSVAGGLLAVLRVQPDVLPSLVVYAALYTSLPLTAATAVVGGLCLDALSTGPLGLSVIPLTMVGLVLHWRRELLLRESVWAQALLGGAASLAVPVMSLVLLYLLWPVLSGGPPGDPQFPEVQQGLGALPEVMPGALVQIPLLGVLGVVATPLVFRAFRWVDATFQYRPVPQAPFRTDREIRRGRF